MPSEKTLKRIVIILGVLLVTGFFAIAGTIIYRSINPDWDSLQTPVKSISFSLAIPEGAELIDISLNREVIIVEVITLEKIRQKLVYDSSTGEFLGELVLERQ